MTMAKTPNLFFLLMLKELPLVQSPIVQLAFPSSSSRALLAQFRRISRHHVVFSMQFVILLTRRFVVPLSKPSTMPGYESQTLAWTTSPRLWGAQSIAGLGAGPWAPPVLAPRVLLGLRRRFALALGMGCGLMLRPSSLARRSKEHTTLTLVLMAASRSRLPVLVFIFQFRIPEVLLLKVRYQGNGNP